MCDKGLTNELRSITIALANSLELTDSLNVYLNIFSHLKVPYFTPGKRFYPDCEIPKSGENTNCVITELLSSSKISSKVERERNVYESFLERWSKCKFYIDRLDSFRLTQINLVVIT